MQPVSDFLTWGGLACSAGWHGHCVGRVIKPAVVATAAVHSLFSVAWEGEERAKCPTAAPMEADLFKRTVGPSDGGSESCGPRSGSTCGVVVRLAQAASLPVCVPPRSPGSASSRHLGATCGVCTSGRVPVRYPLSIAVHGWGPLSSSQIAYCFKWTHSCTPKTSSTPAAGHSCCRCPSSGGQTLRAAATAATHYPAGLV